MQPRKWKPDHSTIADQLVAAYRNATNDGVGHLNAVATMESWELTTRTHGAEFTSYDWHALVQELARRAASTS